MAAFDGIIRSANWTEDSKTVLHTFFTHANCFGNIEAGAMQVIPYVTTTQSSLEIAQLEYAIINNYNIGTGMGAKGTNALFQFVVFEITIKDSEKEGITGREVELELDRKADILTTFFRSVNGRPALGTAGIKKANLSGPIPVRSKYYYERKFLLSGRIEVG